MRSWPRTASGSWRSTETWPPSGVVIVGEKDKHRDDMAFAASARVHDGVLVTRNVKDFVDCGVRVLDPFKRKPEVVTV